MSDSTDRVAQYYTDRDHLVAALLDPGARVVIANTLQYGQGHERGGGAFGPVDDQAVEKATSDILAALAARSMTITRPRLLSRRAIEELLPAARAAWTDAGGEDDVDAGLRAVVAELTVLIAFQLGRASAARRR
ncbi:hypothetical protein Ssi03_74420 [Sphaerisporangium siamense]|uniref:Uncharacterized protein n=1 Tax=Sphaerisporangium siamense TaxID=795645 RepID=A0A7W7GBB9_9ACTN|nr:hypothetical protein [Sphaerisporangium siamense]MBB4702294.1 hypothetical protein [Sphaerisporangium siamense]GII89452.1 hypothetical protein Ssi03_74420 [Sphaerisporangium siamense]